MGIADKSRADSSVILFRDPIAWDMKGSVPTGLVWYPEVWAGNPGRILYMAGQTGSGTCTVTVKINGVAVTGLTAVAFDSSARIKFDATALNEYAEGDEISMDITSASGNDFRFAIAREGL